MLSESFAPAPRSDRRRSPCLEVIEHDTLDIMGRRQFAAVDEHSREIANGVAASEEEAERVSRRLYESLWLYHTRPRLTLLP